MIVSKKNESDKNFFSRLTNEFLFAREFEYESPLTPDELVSALKAIENIEARSWVLSMVALKHQFSSTAHGDKAIDFKISLQEDKRSAWSSRMNLQYIEGRIQADAATGMSIITGKTHFSAMYYGIWIFVFAVNIFPLLTGFATPMTWFWLGLALVFWLAMYQERNALADRLDEIIMHAKSAKSLAILDEEDDLSLAETLLEAQEKRSLR